MQMISDNHLINSSLELAASLIHANRLEEAGQILSEFQEESHPGYWFLKGLLKQKEQAWGEAINHFHRCLDLDPGHAGAAAGRDICNNILNFWNPSLFNP